jgi:hypothetical protein
MDFKKYILSFSFLSICLINITYPRGGRGQASFYGKKSGNAHSYSKQSYSKPHAYSKSNIQSNNSFNSNATNSNVQGQVIAQQQAMQKQIEIQSVFVLLESLFQNSTSVAGNPQTMSVGLRLMNIANEHLTALRGIQGYLNQVQFQKLQASNVEMKSLLNQPEMQQINKTNLLEIVSKIDTLLNLQVGSQQQTGVVTNQTQLTGVVSPASMQQGVSQPSSIQASSQIQQPAQQPLQQPASGLYGIQIPSQQPVVQQQIQGQTTQQDMQAQQIQQARMFYNINNQEEFIAIINNLLAAGFRGIILLNYREFVNSWDNQFVVLIKKLLQDPNTANYLLVNKIHVVFLNSYEQKLQNLAREMNLADRAGNHPVMYGVSFSGMQPLMASNLNSIKLNQINNAGQVPSINDFFNKIKSIFQI